MPFLFFFFLLYSITFLLFQLLEKKFKVKLILAFQTGAPIILVNETIDTPPVVALKTIKILSISSKVAAYLLNF